MKRRSSKKPLPSLSIVVARKQLWLDWSQQPYFKPLDRYLKSRMKGLKDLRREDKLKVSQQIQDAARYLQAAEYLEACYQDNELKNAALWDQEYTLFELKYNSVQVFWFWVFLLAGDQQHASTSAEVARVKWFQSHQEDFSQDIEQYALINGFRPQWMSLLTQRAVLEKWDDQQIKRFIKRQNEPLPIYLRPQSQLPNSEIIKQLQLAGVKAQPDQESICLRGGEDVSKTELYKTGQIEIQDLASQQIAAAVDCQPGMKVWDCCAGAGGKSLALASAMGTKGSVTATDVHAYKLDELSKRAKRAGFHNIRSFVWDGNSTLRLPNDVRRQGGFDRVLIDAPCSSSGTWRRNPDARWRFNTQDSLAQVELQQQILKFASQSVRPGGYCIYATCSWQVSENEAQVAEFLAQNPEFILRQQAFIGGIQSNSDSMFYAVLERQS